MGIVRPAGRKTLVGPVVACSLGLSTTEWSESAACASRVEVPNPTGEDRKQRRTDDRGQRGRETGRRDFKTLFPSCVVSLFW